MAVIKNNKTGFWEVRTYYKDLAGNHKQKTKRGFEKKSETLEWERNFKQKEDQSISMDFKNLVEIYLQNIEPRIKKILFLLRSTLLRRKYFRILQRKSWMILNRRIYFAGRMKL